MSLVKQELKTLLGGISPMQNNASAAPLVLDCVDLLPSEEGLKAISWVALPGIDVDQYMRRYKGTANTPEGTFYIEAGQLKVRSGSSVSNLGPAISCDELVTYKGCVAVRNPGGIGGILVYPPIKYPVTTPRVGALPLLGDSPLGNMDTNGCFWFGTGELGLLEGFVQHENFLLMFCRKGILAWNIIYDFNNFLGGYPCTSAAGDFSKAYFITTDGVLYEVAKTEIKRLGYKQLFSEGGIELCWEPSLGALLLYRETTGTLWIYKEGLMRVSLPVSSFGWDHTHNWFFIVDTSGVVHRMDDYSGLACSGHIKSNNFHLGLPGVKLFSALALMATQDISYEITAITENGSFVTRQEGFDNVAPLDREGVKLRLQISPVGLLSGEVIQSSLLLYKSLDRRLMNDVLSNG